MKKFYILFILLALLKNGFAQYGYKCESEFIGLNPINSSICFVKIEDISVLNKIIEQQGKYTKITKNANNGYLLDTILSKKIKPMYESNIYKSKHGYKTIVLPEIIVSVEKAHVLKKLLDQYAGVISLSKEKKDRYVLDCNCITSEGVLQLVQEIDQTEGIKWCKPGMLSEIKYESNSDNTYFSNQYYLQNMPCYGGSDNYAINAVMAWNLVSGNSNVKVAVIDQGVERNHEDLQGAVLDGYTCNLPTEKGDPIHQNVFDAKGHGVASAGIIAAIDNTKGIKGVASGVKILPVNISPDYVSIVYNENTYTNEIIGEMADPEDISDAIDWAVDNGADVLNCSWSHETDNSIINSINNAVLYGRNGKGCVVVCSSGNYVPAHNVFFPGNMARTIAVGAINKTGNIWDYSCRGSSLDLVAPSGDGNSSSDIFTTDRMGNLGFNPPINNYTEIADTNYTMRFGGTSAACSQVTGVVALMLSANPDLTAEKVKSILQNTAQKLPGMNGYNRTDTYGYGLVDAHKAVLGSFYISGQSIPCGTCVYSIANLPSGYTVTWSWLNPYNSGLSADPTLQQNTPSTNMCTITNSSQLHIHNTLVATVFWNGVQMVTLKKDINTGSDFSTNITGTYSGLLPDGMLPPPDIPSTTICDNDTINAMGGYQLTMTSNAFSTHTVSYSGTIVKNWSNTGNGTITVKLQNINSSSYVTVYGTNGCQHFQFRIYAERNMIPLLRDESVSVSTIGKLCTVKLDCDAVDISGNVIDSEEVSKSSMQWHYSVVNVLTGATVLENDVEGTLTTFDMSKYPSGLYLIKVEMDDQTVSKKISI